MRLLRAASPAAEPQHAVEVVAPPGPPLTLLKRRANAMMRSGFDPGERMPFMCECPSERCYRTVWLTAGEYDGAFGDTPLVAHDG